MSRPTRRRVDQLEGLPGNFVAAGSSLVMNQRAHAGRTILLDTATGSTVTLPAATGSGLKYRFLVSALATSNSHIVRVANATDAMIGQVFTQDTDSANVALAFAAVAGTSDTITLNRTTTGSVTVGEWIEVEDVRINSTTNRYFVTGMLTCNGIPATPFSATV